MNKNSLILEIKNDLNSIKKQLDVTLAKIDVLEALIKLEVRSEELGVNNAPVSVIELVEMPETQSVGTLGSSVREEEPEIEEELEITPNSSLPTPNCETPAAFRNLMSVISLGDKFRFRHDLFSDSDDLFRDTIEILNTIEKFTEAVDYLDEKFNWDSEDATVVYFYDIIKPKFNN